MGVEGASQYFQKECFSYLSEAPALLQQQKHLTMQRIHTHQHKPKHNRHFTQISRSGHLPPQRSPYLLRLKDNFYYDVALCHAATTLQKRFSSFRLNKLLHKTFMRKEN